MKLSDIIHDDIYPTEPTGLAVRETQGLFTGVVRTAAWNTERATSVMVLITTCTSRPELEGRVYEINKEALERIYEHEFDS